MITKQEFNQAAKICIPLIGADAAALGAELAAVLRKEPDLIEWRADFFSRITDTQAVLAQLAALQEGAGAIPLIFTIRSVREGGQSIALDEAAVTQLKIAVCQQAKAAYVDCELSCGRAYFAQVQTAAAAAGVKIIASYHNFDHTPDKEELAGKLALAQAWGAAVGKAAVMPRQLEDVLRLLAVTLEAREILSIPVITMAMGEQGVVTRLCGSVFGSAVTFAAGEHSSAPGQMPAQELRQAAAVLQRAMGG